LITSTGNIIGGNLNTGAQVVATGNITGGNLITAGLITVTGNITSGNINTGGLISVVGNVTGGNFLTTGLISATGNIVSAANVSSGNVLGSSGVYGPIFTTLIDSGDSSAITITPDVVMSASMTIQQDLFVDNLTTTRDLDVTGRIIASGNISGPVAVLAAVFAGNIVATGNISANNITATTSINIAGAQVATIDDAAALAIALG
jgi:hypothetical protein